MDYGFFSAKGAEMRPESVCYWKTTTGEVVAVTLVKSDPSPPSGWDDYKYQGQLMRCVKPATWGRGSK